MSLEYGVLTPAERETIWRLEMNRTCDWHAMSDAEYEKLAQLELDGRTIKKTVRVLRLYFGPEKEKHVSMTDVKIALEMATGNIDSEAKKQVDEFIRQPDN